MATKSNHSETAKPSHNQVDKRYELLRDDSLEDLRTHLNQWRKDRVSSSAAGDLNDHFYLIGVVKDMVQDTGELFNITLGILDRLIELNDLLATDDPSQVSSHSDAPKPHQP